MSELSRFYDQLTSEQRKAIADSADTTVDYLYQVCRGDRNASPDMAKRLSAATSIPKSVWRPDIWEVA